MADLVPLVAILAGGESRRMGREKASLEVGGVAMIERVHRSVSTISERVVAVGGRPLLSHLSVPTIPDRYPGANAMGGIATALEYAAERINLDAWVLCVACDTPLLQPDLLQALFEACEGYDVVVPRTETGYEPLCALYRTLCLSALREEISSRNFCVFDIYPRVRLKEIAEPTLRRHDPELRSFLNVNRPQDVERVRQAILHV